ncbi:MAG: hypothetical protein LBJ22_06565, partial [Synergistaceae bacterium]|nr:hypothetical protein [Synergistaceae bacterium]
YPVLGIGRYFDLTKENLGDRIFGDILKLVESLEPNEENRVMPTSAQLSSVGVGVRCRYPDGTEQDITDIITIEIELNDKAQGKLKFVYGCMLVDRKITNQEGEMIDNMQHYVSDGKDDSKLEATWWITNANIGSESDRNSSGGCDLGFVGLALACLPIFVVLSRKKRG